MNTKAKGNKFERDFCKQLSQWWGQSDDLFWRTANSGGRATSRRKQNKETRNSYGDIQSTDQSSQPFTDLIVIEIKRGYTNDTIANLIDYMPGKPLPTFGKWIEKIQNTTKEAGVPYWMIVAKRDKRDVICYFPTSLWNALWDAGAELSIVSPSKIHMDRPYLDSITFLRLSEFFAKVHPNAVRKLHKKHRRKNA